MMLVSDCSCTAKRYPLLDPTREGSSVAMQGRVARAVDSFSTPLCQGVR